MAKNRETVAKLGAGGDIGKERYQSRLQPLLAMKPAYDKYDQAMAALQKKDTAGAKALAADAARLQPREAQFQQLLGDIAVSEKRDQEALGYFQKAQQLNPGHYGSWLGAGIAQYRLKNHAAAQQALKRSYDLLPTAPAALYLGNLSRDSGNAEAALQFYQAAASSENTIGQEAAREAAVIDLPRNPSKYVVAQAARNSSGQLGVVVVNRASVPVGSIAVTPVMVNAAGQIISTGRTVNIKGPLQAGAQVTVDAGLGSLTAEQLQALRFRIDSAQVAQ